MTDLFLTYRESQTGGDAIDPDNSWPSYTDSYTDFSPNQIYIDRDTISTYMIETIKVEETVKRGDTVYLVVLRYGTGSTFGHESGKWRIEGCFKSSTKATKLANDIKTDAMYEIKVDENKWNRYSHKSKDTAPKKPTGYPRMPESYYKVWNGYFESYEDVTVYTLLVQ